MVLSSRMKLSPLAPKKLPTLPKVNGVLLGCCCAKIKNWNKLDVLVMEFVNGTSVAGVFTKSYTAGFNVKYCREVLPYGVARVLIVNSGNANVANGQNGVDTVNAVVNKCVTYFGCKREEIFFSSTGVIGREMPIEKLISGVSTASANLHCDTNNWYDAAVAITTTDTYPKMVTRTVRIDNVEVIINGIAKGSGMIAPNMATLLAYIVTDANICSSVLQELLNEYVDLSLNSITVDGDTSTSDTLLMFATNQANHRNVKNVDDPSIADFKIALLDVMVELAHLIVKDGEGATKFITIEVSGTENNCDAKVLALSVANSPLVKTALSAAQNNWGRIMMAIGKAGIPFLQEKVSILVGNMLVLDNGKLTERCFHGNKVKEHLNGSEILIEVSVGDGHGKAVVWTCDLTHTFIDINARYLS